jgi:hypothetical protein
MLEGRCPEPTLLCKRALSRSSGFDGRFLAMLSLLPTGVMLV